MSALLSDRSMANARIVPVAKPNQVKLVTKLANGDLRCEQASGNIFDIPASEIEMQAFVIYTMLNSEVRA